MGLMDKLRATYLARLPERIHTLEAALAAGATGVPELRRIAHALRGSGASYGFPAISEAAALLEDCAEDQVAAFTRKLTSVLRDPEAQPEGPFVLLISSDPATQAGLSAALAGLEQPLEVVTSGVRAKHVISESTPALILLDLLLPDMDGRRLLKSLRGTRELEEVPLIVLAARGNSRLREECFALGADQYFDKACDPTLLAVTVESALNRMLRAASTTQMRVMSRLLSADAFAELYQRRVLGRRERGRSLLLLELGALPEEQGDAVLHRVAGAILKRVRLGDHLARWGSSQLLLLAHETHRAGASALVRRLEEAIEADPFRTREGAIYRTSVQAGVVPLERDPPALEEVMARAQAALAREQERVGVSAGAHPTAHTQTVLLAEDDPEFAALVRYALAQGGFEVELLTSGEGVIEYALERRVVLFLLDGNLPGTSGFEVLRKIRSTPLLRELPVALLTALGSEQDVVRGLELGADDYIVKPCSPKELLARVRRLVRLRDTKQAPELAVGGISGKFAGEQLAELLQMLGANDKSGRLLVWGSKSNGQLSLRDGRVVGARASSGRTGEEAAHEVLLAQEGRFEFDPSLTQEADSMNLPVGPLLMEVMRRKDELGQL